MKSLRRILYIILVIIIIILSITIYSKATESKEQNQEEKVISEISFLESKLVGIFNKINNIDIQNYKISVSEISEQNDEKGSERSQEENQGEESSGEGSEGQTSKSKNNKKFDLVQNGVLVNTNDIDWTGVKSEIEILYSSIPTITLDLYNSNINQEDILSFNKDFDNLTITLKGENKQEVLSALSTTYNYISKFLNQASNDELKKTIIETKSNIFKAYSILDSKNWEEISRNTASAIDVYSKLLTNTDIDASKQYIISKGYIMINELQNAVSAKDETVFLIKYKNLLEEINNI